MTRPIRMLFICHGNICRSPMAEYVFIELARQRGALNRFEIESAATSTEELGNNVYPPARRILEAHGIPCPRRAARQVHRSEASAWDCFVCMDDNNVRNLRRMLPNAPEGSIVKLMAFAGIGERAEPEGLGGSTAPDVMAAPDVADPWYSHDFESCYADVLAGCQGLLNALLAK